jgi:hypothetical protein
MSRLKDLIAKSEARLAADHAEARRIIPAAPASDAPDPELEAALAKVASGELATAFRTRNGSLVTTRTSGGPMHKLQESGKAD